MASCGSVFFGCPAGPASGDETGKKCLHSLHERGRFSDRLTIIMNDTVFFTLVTAVALLHAGLIYLNRHPVTGTDCIANSRPAAMITRMANIAALAGWGGLVIFIAVAQGQPASNSVPTLLGVPLLLIPAALLGHAISVALRRIQGYTAEGSIQDILSVARKASSGLFAATAVFVTAVGNLLVLVVKALPGGLGRPSRLEEDDDYSNQYWKGSFYNSATGKFDPGGMYVWGPGPRPDDWP